jgi:3-oxoacyl-[acyl-carrier protein] reductase
MDKSIAIVTGAASGIGRAIAIQLARDGFKVVINYHTRQDDADAVRALILSEGGEALLHQFDVAQPQAVEEAIRGITRSEGPIQVLVNNAGIIRDHLLMRMPDEAWHQVIDTDLTGMYFCTKAVVKSMAGKRRPGRRIINITSIAGETGNVGQTNYAAAKAGVIGFSKALARELAPLQITVNAVAPGAIETEAVKHFPLPPAELARRIPLGRIGRPEDVAAAVAFLASDRAGYITGQVIRVDGGLLM